MNNRKNQRRFRNGAVEQIKYDRQHGLHQKLHRWFQTVIVLFHDDQEIINESDEGIAQISQYTDQHFP